MKSSANAVRLDPRRVEQLKSLGIAMRLSSAGVVAALIREKIAAGVIPADIPGTTVRKVPDGIIIDVGQCIEKTFSIDGALAFADAIRSIVGSADTGRLISMDFGFEVGKQGTGYKLSVALPADGVAFPADLAIDLADLIKKTAE